MSSERTSYTSGSYTPTSFVLSATGVYNPTGCLPLWMCPILPVSSGFVKLAVTTSAVYPLTVGEIISLNLEFSSLEAVHLPIIIDPWLNCVPAGIVSPTL